MFIRLPGVHNEGECKQLDTNKNSKLQMKKLGKVKKVANGLANKNRENRFNCYLRLYCAKGRLK